MDKFDLKKYIAEGKILKENTTKFPEYKEGEIFLERYEHSNIVERFSKNLSKEEYDFYVKNGEDAFFDKYPNATGDFVFIDRPIENSTKEDEYKIVVDNNIDENKSANQIKEDTSKSPEYKEGETILRRIERIDRFEYYDYLVNNKEEYDYILENGVDEFIDKYFMDEDQFEYNDIYEKIIETNYNLGNRNTDKLTPIEENKSTK